MGNLRGGALLLKSAMIMAGIVLFGSTLAEAQSVTATGDVTPAVPPPPLTSWDPPEWLRVGATGAGTLTIEGGGTVGSVGAVTDASIGDGANAQGEARVTGAGSEWLSDHLYVGFQGKGILTVENGGKVGSDVINIAHRQGSEGMVTITGAGSMVAAEDLLTVGRFGKGTIIVEKGGRLESYLGYIGYDAGGDGLVTVRGAGSVWQNDQILAVGFSGAGKGTLRIEEGGLVKSGKIIYVGNPDATATGTLFIDSQSRLEGGTTFRQSASGTYIVGIGATTAGLVSVADAATISAGAKLEVVLEGGNAHQVGERFKVLDAASVADNAYTLVNGGAVSAFLTVDDDYDVANGDVYIEFTGVRALSAAAVTPNQGATAQGAESSGAVAGLFQALASDAGAQDAFDQTSGEAHASIKTMLIGDSHFLRGAVLNRLHAVTPGSEDAAMAAIDGGNRIAPAADVDIARPHSGIWLSGFGSWGDWDGDDNAARLDRSIGGTFIGVDTDLDGWRLGAVAGYSHSSFDVDDRNSSGSVDGYHVGLYGGTMWESIALRAGASYTWNDIETKRNITNPADQELKADYGADTIQVFGELAYVADLGGLVLEPFANVAYVNLHTDSFDEHGGTLALESKSDDADSVSTILGLRPELRFDLGDMGARLRGLAGWRHAFGDITPDARLAFEGGDAFTIRGVPMARDTAVIEAGLDLALSDSATLGAAYQGEFGDGVSDNGFTAKLGVMF